MTFGKRLRVARLAKGYTQAQLGEMVDVSDAAVRMWESDRREPDIERIRLLAAALDVSIEQLFGPSPGSSDVEDRPIPETDLDTYLRQHDLWFKGQPLTYAEKLAARQAIELLRKAMEASKEEPGKEDLERKS